MKRSVWRSAQAGFTLVELMVVVGIISILAAISSVAYGRYVGKARLTEASAVLAEMVSKEQTYAMEFAAFLPLEAGGSIPTQDATLGFATTEVFTRFWPSIPSSTFDSRTTTVSIANTANHPATWRAVGLRPKNNNLFCTYLANANNPPPLGSVANCTTGTDPACRRNIVGPYGQRMFGCSPAGTNCAPTRWFYALGVCNLRKPNPTGSALAGSAADQMTVVGLSSATAQLGVWNEGL